MILIIETSTERGVIGIAQDGKVIYQKELPFGYQNSTYLMPLLEEALNNIKLSPNSLKAVAVGIGPGSYTGIRVGVAAAKGFAFSLKLPLIGISSLFGFIPLEEGAFAAVIDAKIGGAYFLRGHKSENKIIYYSDPAVIALSHLKEAIKDCRWLVSPNSQALQSKVELAPGQHWQDRGPSLEQLALLAQEKFENKDFSLNAKTDILYLRKTQAELEKQ